MDAFPLAGVLRRIRRSADWSQRELAREIGASRSTVAAAESGTRDLTVSLLARAASAAGGRLLVVDSDGNEVLPMADGAVRDAGGRLFPAHLDTRHGDEQWWGGPHRPRLRQPRYTFDRDRTWRDGRRGDAGTPADHHTPQPGDSLAEREAARLTAALRARAAERERRFLEGPRVATPDPFVCSCPPACEYDEALNPDLTHAPLCECRCDVA